MPEFNGAFDPETIAMLRDVLDEAYAAIPKSLREPSIKTELAAVILKKASAGQRDPTRLRTQALAEIIAAHGSNQPHAA